MVNLKAKLRNLETIQLRNEARDKKIADAIVRADSPPSDESVNLKVSALAAIALLDSQESEVDTKLPPEDSDAEADTDVPGSSSSISNIDSDSDCEIPGKADTAVPSRTWIRHDSNSFVFRVPGKDGPSWDHVHRRVTFDAETLGLIDDDPLVQFQGRSEVHRKIPNGPHDIITVLYHDDSRCDSPGPG